MDKKSRCTCGHIACVCGIIRNHEPDCPFRLSVICPVGIACDHGYEVCPICDPCTCPGGIEARGIA